jgi:diguanylate cyclase (GGDEF)-like protein
MANQKLRPAPAYAITDPDLPAKHDPATPEVGPGMYRVQDPELGQTSEEPYIDDDDMEVTDASRITDAGLMSPLLERSTRPVLLRMDGVLAGEVVALEKTSITIGRHPSCELRLDDSGISRRHARIIAKGQSHSIDDLDSRNGTYVNGQCAVRARLHDGDWIQLGPRVSLRYAMVDEQQERLLRQLYESSMRDSLTGAYSRKHFEDRLKSELAFAARHHTDAALILIDIDHFKKVNDTYGHPAGDAVLRQVATAIRHRLRTEDLFARIGGEEFAVLLRGTNRLGAARAAERLRATIAAVPAVVGGKTIPVTVSAGCAALACCRDRTQRELIAAADRRLYAAKRAGRNRVVASD